MPACLKHSELPFNQKHPIILPACHAAVQLLVEREHKANNHEGTEEVRSVVHQKYWIIGQTNLVQRLQLNCVLCQKQDKLGRLKN